MRVVLVVLAALISLPAMAEPDPFGGTCIVKPRVTVQLGSPVSGILSATMVDRGDLVKKGQLVAQLESSVEQAALALDKLRAANDTAVKTEMIDKELLAREAERKRSLVDKGIANQNSMDELDTKVREGELRVQQAEMDRRIAALSAERTERALALKQIRSPIDGIVVERKLSAGEYIHEQTSIMMIAQVDPLNVEVVLPLQRYGTIKVGDVAIVHLAPPVGGAYPSKADVVDTVIDAASDTFGVRLVLPNPDRTIPAGVRCTVQWQVGG